MPIFQRDGIEFHFRDEGGGLPFVFQHGLGSDTSQPFELVAPSANVRLIAFDFRGHGQTAPLGNSARLTIPDFAEDVARLVDHLSIAKFVVGGTSLGAAVAMRFALRYPSQVLALVLSRPAWLEQAPPPNLHVLTVVAALLRRHGAGGAHDVFRRTREYQTLIEESPASADSILRLCSTPHPTEMAACLESIPMSRPCEDLRELQSLDVPTLVLAAGRDPIHPLEYGQRLYQYLPQGKFVEITPRSESVAQHMADVRRAVETFLKTLGRTDER